MEYNQLYYSLGTLSKIAGLGVIVYGLFTQDVETIAGGTAMAFVGRGITKDCRDFQRNINEIVMNEILKWNIKNYKD